MFIKFSKRKILQSDHNSNISKHRLFDAWLLCRLHGYTYRILHETRAYWPLAVCQLHYKVNRNRKVGPIAITDNISDFTLISHCLIVTPAIKLTRKSAVRARTHARQLVSASATRWRSTLAAAAASGSDIYIASMAAPLLRGHTCAHSLE